MAESEKIDFLISGYNQLYPGKGGLSKFFVWDNDYEKRIEINEPFIEFMMSYGK